MTDDKLIEELRQASLTRDEYRWKAADRIEQLAEALKCYANANNWTVIPGDRYDIQRVWLEPYSNTRDAYDGFDMARKALGLKHDI